MKGWKTALALGAAAAAAGAVAGEYFYRFALTQQIDKTAAFNAPHNRPTGAPRGTLAADREWLNAQPHEDWWLTSGDGLQLHALCVRAGGNAPWAVLCHGYTGQASGMAEYARRFYDAGFSLLLPDARGHGQSERYMRCLAERRTSHGCTVTAENGAGYRAHGCVHGGPPP
jgi:dienelactone hydrolase